MDDRQVIQYISELVDEEHRLRTGFVGSRFVSEPELRRLDHLEEQLDQMWDLLRRRRALRDLGTDPDLARVRSVAEVESYLQ